METTNYKRVGSSRGMLRGDVQCHKLSNNEPRINYEVITSKQGATTY